MVMVEPQGGLRERGRNFCEQFPNVEGKTVKCALLWRKGRLAIK